MNVDPRIIVPAWPAPPGVHAAFTLRQGGVSQAPYDSFNLGDHVGDDSQAVEANRAALLRRLSLPTDPLWLHQMHGCDIARGRGDCEADGVVVDEPGKVCAIMVADCLPVLFSTRDGSRVAAAHAGWRGLAAGVLENTVASMGQAGDDVLAWLGPCIGPDSFEVGEDVRSAFVDQDAGTSGAFLHWRPGHWLADLPALARRRLGAVGVRSVYGGHWCTYKERENFFSYRRDGVTGRMAALIWMAAPG
ncbi:MAG: peptidoglycan editing factor PgeF [Chromatiales bacterium]|nr:peptidoglycan editing factor PgeF [Chromatiales bacterium]